MFISSSGGHYSELHSIYPHFEDTYTTYFVTEKTPQTENEDVSFLINNNHSQFSIMYFFRFLLNSFISLFLFLRIRPNAIITTGANAGIPMILIGKIFRRKTIFIETSARINQPSKTGRILHKWCNHTIVQWESMLEIYPKSVYGGQIHDSSTIRNS